MPTKLTYLPDFGEIWEDEPGSRIVARVPGPNEDPDPDGTWTWEEESTEVFGRLIAAAPALLAACKDALRELESWDDDPDPMDPCEVVKVTLRAALAQARETP